LLLAAEIDDGGSIRDLLQALPGNVTQNSDLVRAFFEYRNAISTSDLSGVYLWVAENSLVLRKLLYHSVSIVLPGKQTPNDAVCVYFDWLLGASVRFGIDVNQPSCHG
jgi:hypothetical protein